MVLRFAAASLAIALLIGAASVAPAIDWVGYAPAQIADHVITMPEGRTGFPALVTGVISKAFQAVGLAQWLKTANALDRPDDLPLPTWVGAGEANDGVLPPGRLRSVSSIETLRQAIDTAEPGARSCRSPGFTRCTVPTSRFAAQELWPLRSPCERRVWAWSPSNRISRRR